MVSTRPFSALSGAALVGGSRLARLFLLGGLAAALTACGGGGGGGSSGGGGGGGGGGNVAPTASFTATPTTGRAPLSVAFDGSGSRDSDGTISTYSWNFGDGTPTATGATTTHQYTTAGTFTATLTVTDNGGLTNNTTARSRSSRPSVSSRSPSRTRTASSCRGRWSVSTSPATRRAATPTTAVGDVERRRLGQWQPHDLSLDLQDQDPGGRGRAERDDERRSRARARDPRDRRRADHACHRKPGSADRRVRSHGRRGQRAIKRDHRPAGGSVQARGLRAERGNPTDPSAELRRWPGLGQHRSRCRLHAGPGQRCADGRLASPNSRAARRSPTQRPCCSTRAAASPPATRPTRACSRPASSLRDSAPRTAPHWPHSPPTVAGTNLAKIPEKPVSIYPIGSPVFVADGASFFPTLDQLATLEGGRTPLYDAICRVIDFTDTSAPAAAAPGRRRVHRRPQRHEPGVARRLPRRSTKPSPTARPRTWTSSRSACRATSTARRSRRWRTVATACSCSPRTTAQLITIYGSLGNLLSGSLTTYKMKFRVTTAAAVRSRRAAACSARSR